MCIAKPYRHSEGADIAVHSFYLSPTQLGWRPFVMQQPDRPAGPTGRPDTQGNDQTPRQGFLRRYLPWLILPAIAFWLIFLIWQPNSGANGIPVSYSLFIQQVGVGNVASVTLNDNAVTGTFKTPIHSDQTNETGRRFNTTIPNLPSENTVPLLQQQHVQVQV